MSTWRAVGLHPRDVERLELGELAEWFRLERRDRARAKSRAARRG